MNILLFLPSSFKAYDILSLALFLKKNEYTPIFLSSTPKGEMHRLCENYEIPNYSLNIATLNYSTYLFAGIKLSLLIKGKNIDLVLSNNLQGNFVSILAEFIHRKRTILTRHHSDYINSGNNKNAKRQQGFVNRYGKEFIAISHMVKVQMIKEGIKPEKIIRVNLGFDFSLFKKPNINIERSLKYNHSGDFIICSVGRLIPLKRHKLLFEAIRILNDKGLKIILWVVGEGILLNDLKEWVIYYRLEHAIKFFGYVDNPENYISACDLLVHLSESEASSHVIREAGLVKSPVLVCKEVGDFDDYIENESNGFLIEKEITPRQIADKILQLSNEKEKLEQTAFELHKTVLEKFDITKSGKNLINIIKDA